VYTESNKRKRTLRNNLGGLRHDEVHRVYNSSLFQGEATRQLAGGVYEAILQACGLSWSNISETPKQQKQINEWIKKK
jgi:hypothetical protein